MKHVIMNGDVIHENFLEKEFHNIFFSDLPMVVIIHNIHQVTKDKKIVSRNLGMLITLEKSLTINVQK
uniref:Uncharacterized protein n=1 Tax=Romanomermis culicivorax TaxID=13658 RepID=A0A915J9X5_ROMCU